MGTRFLLISGSAADDSPLEELRRASEFVRALVRAAWNDGWCFVTLGSNEPRHTTAPDLSLIFDWIVIDEVMALSKSERGSEGRLHVVSAKKLWAKVPRERMDALLELERAKVARVEVIPDELWLGGRFRDAQVEQAAAMICIGGGKGVTDQVTRMRAAGKPVIPLGFELQGIARDGNGARDLFKSFTVDPSRFLPAAGNSLGTRLFSLDPKHGIDRAAAEHVRLLSTELTAQQKTARLDDLILTVIPVELEAAAAALERFGLGDLTRSPNGTLVRAFTVTRGDGQKRRVGLACIGSAGTAAAAAVLSDATSTFGPRRVLLAGIAAGWREKRRLGETVISEEVVAYELAARVTNQDGSILEPRPHCYRPEHALAQSVAYYLSTKGAAQTRVGELMRELAPFPKPETDSDLTAPRLSATTIAAGDKLARDAKMWTELRAIHGKIDVLEMEGAGVAEACRVGGVPFLLFRGISDHADEHKNDAYHRVAAVSAAAFAVDFIVHGPD